MNGKKNICISTILKQKQGSLNPKSLRKERGHKLLENDCIWKKKSHLSKFHLRIAACSTNTQKHHSAIKRQTTVLVVLSSIFITLYKRDDDKLIYESIFTEKHLSCQDEFHQEIFSSPLAFHHRTEADVETLYVFLKIWKYH